MDKCKLCKIREATQTNSHLLTWSLIKDCLNQPGQKERGYDVTFAISLTDIAGVHIGPSVLPDHIEKVTGNSIENFKPYSGGDPFTRDYIFCQNCEKKMGVLESEFMRLVYKKLERNDFDTLLHDGKGNKRFPLSRYETQLTYAFGYLQFFRISIGDFNKFPLDAHTEEKIRLALVSILASGPALLKEKIEKLNQHLFRFPLPVCYLESEKLDDSWVFQERSKKPYFLWAGKLLFNLFVKDSHTRSSLPKFFGLTETLSLSEYSQNNEAGCMEVCIVDNRKRERLVFTKMAEMTAISMANAKEYFSFACKKFLGRDCTAEEKRKFGHYFSIFSTGKIHDKYSEPFKQAFDATFNSKPPVLKDR